MAKLSKKRRGRHESQAGFTLIEILIVVILLGILATIIIPQVSVSSDDAKLNAVKTNLANMRSAIELYYYQHNNKFPGALDETSEGTATSSDSDAASAFVEQLTKYTNSGGKANNSGTSDYPYGPYLRAGVPMNPFNNLNTVTTDYDETDITAKASSGTFGWKFYPQTGILLANDGSHDSL